MSAPPVARSRRPGFTLIEILLALGIFAIGMIAVASLFPVAALLQRETAAEVVGDHAARSAKALVEAKGLDYLAPVSTGADGRGDLGKYHRQAGNARRDAIPLSWCDPRLLVHRYPDLDRAFPSIKTNNDPAVDLGNRDLFWVPFVQDLNGDPNGTNQNWVLRLFLLEADSRANYPDRNVATNAANPYDPAGFPKVVPIGCSVLDEDTFRLSAAPVNPLEGGDKIMDSNGTDYTIAEVSANGRDVTILGRILLSPMSPETIWYAPSYGGPGSPTQRIVTIKIEVNEFVP